MKKIFFFPFTLIFLLTTISYGQISLTTPNGSYSQDFDVMASGTTFPAGWVANRYAGSAGAGPALTLTVNNGSGNSGAVYNVGTTSAPDRALGTLASASTIPAFGASFINNTPGIITDFSLEGFSEQWRSGSSTTENETIIFEYSTDATSLVTGTWVPVASLNLVELQTTTTTAAAIDGNLPANRIAITGNIASVNLAVGATIWIRWRDADNAGSDGMYALDDFQLTYTNVAAGNTISVAAAGNATEPSASGSFTISINPASGSPAGIDYAFTGTAGFGTDYTVSFSAGTPSDPASASATLQDIPAGTTSITVTVTPVDDSDVEGTESITLTLSNPPAGYSLGTASASISLLDNDIIPTISIAAGTNAAEPATNGSFVISFNTPTTASTSIDFAYAGTATFTSDYTVSYSAGSPSGTAATGTLTVPAGVSSVTVTVTPVDDTDVEPTETIQLTLSNPTAGYTLGTSVASITLSSNDVAPTVSVTAGDHAAEPASNGSFTITLNTAAPAGGITVNYTLTGTATLNTDYTNPQGGSITILQGTTSGTIAINVTDDADAEGPETITITLDNVTAPYTIAGGTASITLSDDDIAPISLTGPYSQDFNSLANTGTANALNITGWGISEGGGGARDNELYAADNGSSTTGDTYSYGTTSQTDRALGSLSSGSLVPSFGAYFINNTGTTVNRLRISYTGEQWRLGAAGRTDRLQFQYSLTATTLSNGIWIDYDPLDFITPNTAGTGAKDGNQPANQAAVSYTITGLNIPNGGTFFIRWNDLDASGADDGLSIDDFSIEINPADAVAPVATSYSPLNGAANIPVYQPAVITFDEDIITGTGNIFVRRVADNSIVQTIAVTSSLVTTNRNRASFTIDGLNYSDAYYVEIEAGTFTDANGNPFAGITGSSTWAFSTRTAPPAGIIDVTYDMNDCVTNLPAAFTQVSLNGAITWVCTTAGHDASDNTGQANLPSGIRINGFANGTNVPNTDWLISPSFDLTGTNFPLLSFWSRVAFNGEPLQLKVSTDYVQGNPANATWTDLNGRFPGQGSNFWKLSQFINLSAFKQPNVHIAFVYNSSDEDGASWTIDDFRIENSSTPPPPTLTLSTSDMQFGFTASGTTAVKSFVFTANDIVSDISVYASSSSFEVALAPGGPYSQSVNLPQATYNNVPTTVYVRFAPATPNINYTGDVMVNTFGINSGDTVYIKGTSIDPINTLEVVNWNIEWLGSPANGPGNEPQQEANVATIMQNIDADLYGLTEIVDEAALARIVGNMPGYSYLITNYGSHTNPYSPTPSTLGDAQKLAFVYKPSVFTNITTEPLLTQGINSAADISNPAYNYYASGRFPFMMTSDVTLNGITKTVRFVLVHAKANTSPTAVSYVRRKNGADTLKYTLNSLYPGDNIIILGDLNDDLDSTITADINPKISSYISFTADTVTTFSPVTLSLSLAGKKSTVSYNDMIDHVIVSNEMRQYFMNNSAAVLNDVSSLVTNYASTTSDHYPVFTRYAFDAILLPVQLTTFQAVKQGTGTRINWTTAQEINSSHFIVERSANGSGWQPIASVMAAGSSTTPLHYQVIDPSPAKGINLYRLRAVDLDGKTEYSATRRVNFDTRFTYSLYPNPAGDLLQLTADDVKALDATIQVVNAQSQLVISRRNNATGQPVALDISSLKPGFYFVRITATDGTTTVMKFVKR